MIPVLQEKLVFILFVVKWAALYFETYKQRQDTKVMMSFRDNSALWGLHELGKTFVTGDTPRRLKPATWLLLSLGTFNISNTSFMANANEAPLTPKR